MLYYLHVYGRAAVVSTREETDNFWTATLLARYPVDLVSGRFSYQRRDETTVKEHESRQTLDAAVMRAKNRLLLLQMIWREQKISRADISRQTGMSPSTVSAIVRDLEHSGLVRDTGTGTSSGGRRPVLVGFCDEAFHIIGVDLGAKHIAVVLTDLRGHVQVFREKAYAVRTDPAGTLHATKALIDECLEAGQVALSRVLGIGVAIPSPLDPEEPGRLSRLIVPAWTDYDIQEWLGERYPLPIFIDNDANLGALAEQWWGERADHFTYIKIGMGIGAGHIIRGELYRGAGGSAGEIGHVIVDPSGPVCRCGNRGCLTMFIGSDLLVARARERMRMGSSEPLDIPAIIDHARQGNPAAQATIEEASHHLSIAIAGLVNILNPAVVVLGGSLAAAGDMLIEPLRASVRSHALSKALAQTRIVASTLDKHSIALGAATLVLATALQDHSLFPLSAAAG